MFFTSGYESVTNLTRQDEFKMKGTMTELSFLRKRMPCHWRLWICGVESFGVDAKICLSYL